MRKFFWPNSAPRKHTRRLLALACLMAFLPAMARADEPWMDPSAFHDLVQG